MKEDMSTNDLTFVQRLKAGLRRCIGYAQISPSHYLDKDTEQLSARLLIALSGGPDSTALLLGLEEISRTHSLQLIGCHVNHRLRGNESERDEIYCQKLCERLAIPFFVFAIDAAIEFEDESPTNTRLKSENFLRERRYAHLVRTALANNADFLVTGHTLDDQAETILFRLFRGTALKGLSGIPHCRTLKDGLHLIRPLLSITKSDCMKYLLEQSVMARKDSSNDDQNYTRNFIRHSITPLIKDRFPDYLEKIESFRAVAQSEDVYLERLAEEFYRSIQEPGRADIWSKSAFNQLHLAMRRRVTALALRERSVEVSFERVERILNLAQTAQEKQDMGETYDLDGEWFFEARHKNLVWYKKAEQPAREFGEISVKIPGKTIVPVLNRVLVVEPFKSNQLSPGKQSLEFPESSAYEALVEMNTVNFPLILRARRPGDVIKPFGRAETVRLKKFLHTRTNLAFPENTDPGALPVLADRDEVLWIPGIGLSEKLRVKRVPTHRLAWLELASDSPNIA